MRRYYDLAFITYVLLSPLCYLLPIPEIIRAFLALPSLVLIPLHFGYALLKLLQAFGKKVLMKQPAMAFFTLSWSLGIIIIISMLLVVYNFFTSLSLSPLIVVIVLFSCFALYDNKIDETMMKTLRSRNLRFIIASIILGLLPITYFRSISAFPSMVAFDQFVYSLQAIRIIEGSLPYIAAFPAFTSIIALSSKMFNVSPISLFWAAPFLLYSLFAVGMYLFCYRLSRDSFLSTLAALIGVWAQGWGIVNELYGLYSKILLYVLFPFSFYIITRTQSSNDVVSTKSKRNIILFLSMGTLPFIFYTLGSPTVYCSISFPSLLKPLFHPFFYFTEPAIWLKLPVCYAQSFYAFLFTSLLYFFLSSFQTHEKLKNAALTYFILLLVSIFLHFEMGIAFGLIIFFYEMISLLLRKYQRPVKTLVLFVVCLYFSYFLFKWMDIDNPISTTIIRLSEFLPSQIQISGGQFYNFSFSFKFELLQKVFTSFIVVTAFIGILFSARDFAVNRRRAFVIFFTSSTLLYLYFLPWPYSYRLLYFITPFIVYYSAYALKSMHALTKTFVDSTLHYDVSIRRSKIRLTTTHLLGAFLIMAVLSSLPVSYLGYVDYLKREYSYEDNVTLHTSLDMDASRWIKSNMPRETLIVSDPMTLKILSGLAGLGYTLDGRMFVSQTVTVPIPQGAIALFKSIVGSYSNRKLAGLYSLYAESDSLRGLNTSSLKEAIIVVNGRTAAWVIGREYSVPLEFSSFSGFERLTTSRTLSLVFNHTGQYYIFKVEREPLVTGKGPYVLFSEIGVPYAHSVLTRYSYYDLFDANFTLTLSGQTSYNVSGYPNSWSFEEVLVNGVPTTPMKGWDANRYVLMSDVTPSDDVTIIWKADLLHKDVGWRDDSFLEGWYQGRVSRKEMEDYGYVSDGDVVTLFLGAGSPGDYTNIKRYDFVRVNSSEYPLFWVRMKGTNNTEALIYLVLENGAVVYPFSYWFKPPGEWTELSENILSKTFGMDIVGIMLIYKTVDGEPATVYVDYVRFTAP